MKIIPTTHILHQYRARRTNYVLLIGEAFDNALDFGATSASADINADDIIFRDNGEGITRLRISALFSLGAHAATSTTQLGRFGIGIKAQAISAGDVLFVDSISRDGRVRAEVDWRSVLRSGEWDMDDPDWSPVFTDVKHGTVIRISNLRRAPRFDIDRILYEIAQRFYPAIAENRILAINHQRVPLLATPALTDTVDKQISLSDGRSAHVLAGMLIRPSSLNRVHIGYRHRVIMPSTGFGCGAYSGLAQMFARVQLAGVWRLAEFKDDLIDEDEREELQEALEDALRPILEKCNDASISARINEMSLLVNEMVPPHMAPARPHKTSKTPNPSDKPKRKKRSGAVDAEKADAGGPARSKKPRDTWMITFEGRAAEHGAGRFLLGHPPRDPHRVELSADDPYVAAFLQHRDTEIGKRAIFALACSIFVHSYQAKRPDPEFQFLEFGQAIGRLMAQQNIGAQDRAMAG
jgi:Histidine kinase-, DNA gyrase B-, and HSP90-like ATPase